VHALFREVCCERIAPGRKAKLHGRLGQWVDVYSIQSNEAPVLADRLSRREW
jgi:hypothetical protein